MAQAYDNYYNDYHKNAELQQNIKYKKKYRKLKRIVKNTVFVSLNMNIILLLYSSFVMYNDKCNFIAGKCSTMRSSCTYARESDGR